METGIKVGDLMTRNFVWASPETNLRECAKIMCKKRVGSLIIKDGEKLKGILTEKDIIWAIIKKSSMDLNKIYAKDLMKRKVVTIKPSYDVIETLKKMKKKKVRRLPVIESGKVIGMITTNDILRIDPGLFELIAENAKIKVESYNLKKSSSQNEGVCEECGDFDVLHNEDGVMICNSCYQKK